MGSLIRVLPSENRYSIQPIEFSPTSFFLTGTIEPIGTHHDEIVAMDWTSSTLSSKNGLNLPVVSSSGMTPQTGLGRLSFRASN